MFQAVALGTKQAVTLEQYRDYRLLIHNIHKKLNHKLESN